MMHRCSSSSQGNMVGPCSCGLFQQTQSNSFSMLYSMPNHHHHPYRPFDDTNDMYSTSPYSSVDCTLSLGTPSTRLCEDDERRTTAARHERRPSSSCMSNFRWDFLQTKNSNTSTHSSQNYNNNNKTSRGGNTHNNLSNNDPLLARRCANCDTTSTPLWRNGPRGPKSLCNACGIRFKKEERRANANNNGNGNTSSGSMDQHYGSSYQNSSWVQSQKMPCFSPAANEFRFIEDNDQDSDTGIPFLSWRLNVTDRPSLVHDFTR